MIPGERWQTFNEFTNRWFGPLGESAGYSEEEIAAAEGRLKVSLPAALREWYGFAGQWHKQKVEVQDDLFAPKQLFWDGKYLIFHLESQSIYAWAIRRQDLTLENPPVYDEQERVLFADSLTTHLFLSLCNEIEIGEGIEENHNGSPRIPYPPGLLQEVRQHLSQPG